MAVNPRSLNNLKVIKDSERARELAQLSAQARRRNKEEREKQAALTLAQISYGTLVKAQIEPDVPWTSRIQAAIASLNREEGMPTQRVEQAQVAAGKFKDMPSDELERRLAEHEARGLHAVEGEPAASSIPKAQSETP